VYLFKPPGAEELKISEEEKKAREQADWKKAAEAAPRPGPDAESPPDSQGRPADDHNGKAPADGKGGKAGRGDRPDRDPAAKAERPVTVPAPAGSPDRGKRP